MVRVVDFDEGVGSVALDQVLVVLGDDQLMKEVAIDQD